MDVPSRAETGRREERRRRAMLAADLDELDSLLSDDLVYVHSSAAVDGKTSYLEKLRDGTIVYRDLAQRVDSLLVRPGLAVVVGGVSGWVELHGSPTALDNRVVAVWATGDDAALRLVSCQSTPVAR